MLGRALIVAAALGLALTACAGDPDGGHADTGELTRKQYDLAVNAARHEVENQDATVTSATAIIKHSARRDAPSNTGLECTSDQVLKVRLIGDFPHTVTGGPPGGDPNGGTVTEMDLEVDAVTGDPCLIGVGTSQHPEPEQGATILQLDD